MVVPLHTAVPHAHMLTSKSTCLTGTAAAVAAHISQRNINHEPRCHSLTAAMKQPYNAISQQLLPQHKQLLGAGRPCLTRQHSPALTPVPCPQHLMKCQLLHWCLLHFQTSQLSLQCCPSADQAAHVWTGWLLVYTLQNTAAVLSQFRPTNTLGPPQPQSTPSQTVQRSAANSNYSLPRAGANKEPHKM
jgi:hypothetical protein